MTNTQRLYAVLSALVLAAVALLGGVTSPASASGAVPISAPDPSASEAQKAMATKPSSCGDSLLCLYTDARYLGRQQSQYARANGTCDGVLYNDQVSSIWNGSGKSVRFYNDAGCRGQAFSLPNGQGSEYMTITHPTQVDELTSFKWGA